ncbi:MAG TPA: glycosyltransferase [Bacteroidales bacterium]|nr:glycosyltransferase [Bacteroidales bacterium]
MRRIIIMGTAHPYRGGLAAFNERLAAEFQNGNDNVRIETFTLQYPNILFPGRTQYADWPPPGNLNIKRTINSVWPPNWLRVANRIKKEKPDIVIFKYWLPLMAPCFGSIARIIKKNRHTQIITILDNIVPHEGRPGDKLLTRYFVKPIDGFIGMSASVLDDLNIFDSDKPRLFSPHPVFDNFGQPISREEALEKLDLDPGYRYILFFGLVREYKGLDIMIEAFAGARKENKNLKLIVAGEFYTSPEPYKKQIKNLELEDDIILHPSFIPDNEVAKWFCASDIVAQPYKTATQSGVTQIGYHFDKPMLVSNVGGLSEIIPHGRGGYVVRPVAAEVTEALYDFFTNNRHDEFTAGIRSEKRKYSWKTMVKNVYLLSEQIRSS